MCGKNILYFFIFFNLFWIHMTCRQILVFAWRGYVNLRLLSETFCGFPQTIKTRLSPYIIEALSSKSFSCFFSPGLLCYIVLTLQKPSLLWCLSPVSGCENHSNCWLNFYYKKKVRVYKKTTRVSEKLQDGAKNRVKVRFPRVVFLKNSAGGDTTDS
jgi:hypothetical protein